MTAEILNHNIFNSNKMIVVPVKEGENIEKALKKFTWFYEGAYWLFYLMMRVM